jgi:hypothetical protein
VKNIVDSMKTEDVRTIEAAQEQFCAPKWKANFSSLTKGIKCFQEKEATLEDSLALVQKIASDLEKVSGDIGL